MPLPTIDIVNDDLAVQCVVAKFGQHDRPNHPVDTTSGDDTEANHAVKVVR